MLDEALTTGLKGHSVLACSGTTVLTGHIVACRETTVLTVNSVLNVQRDDRNSVLAYRATPGLKGHSAPAFLSEYLTQ